MRLLTTKELNKIFSLKQSKNVKSRVRKKNHKRVMRYLDKYGLVTIDMLKKSTHIEKQKKYLIFTTKQVYIKYIKKINKR